jgi:hypothetical protein
LDGYKVDEVDINRFLIDPVRRRNEHKNIKIRRGLSESDLPTDTTGRDNQYGCPF